MPTNDDFMRDLQKIASIVEKYAKHQDTTPPMMRYHLQQMCDRAKEHIQRQPSTNGIIPPPRRLPQQDPTEEKLLHNAKNAYHCLHPNQRAFLRELTYAAYDATGYQHMSTSGIDYMTDQGLITRVTTYATNTNPYRLTRIGRATLNHV